MKQLTTLESERYAANIALCEIDLAGQRKLLDSRVLVCGCGALASPVLLYLAAAGVGHIAVADADVVAISNLQRQIVHATSEVGESKVESARRRLLDLNPQVEVTPIAQMVTAANAAELMAPADVVIDCTDNFPTRTMLSRTAKELGKPLCFGGVSRFQAQVLTQTPHSAGYADLFPSPPDPEELQNTACSRAGVLNTIAGLAGSIQATEAIKIILGIGDLLVNRMLLIDALTFQIQIINLQ